MTDKQRMAAWLAHLLGRELLEMEYPTDSRGRILHPPPPIDWDQHEHLSNLADQAHALMGRGLDEEAANVMWRDALDLIGAEA